jgi:hypothetical protein
LGLRPGGEEPMRDDAFFAFDPDGIRVEVLLAALNEPATRRTAESVAMLKAAGLQR